MTNNTRRFRRYKATVFDVLDFCVLMEHLCDDSAQLQNLQKLLESNGRIIAILLPKDHYAYEHAIEADNAPAVALLLKAGVPYSANETWMRNPPFLAVVYGRLDIIRLFLDSGLDINIREGNGGEYDNTLLATAVIHKQDEAMKLLLERGADPNLICDGGYTALDMVHVERGYGTPAEQLLCSYGAQ